MKKIKTIIHFLFILLSSLCCNTFAQCDLEGLINQLYSSDPLERESSAFDIADCNLRDALPKIEGLWNEEEDYNVKIQYLQTLYVLGSDQIVDYSLEIVNSKYNSNRPLDINPYYGKVIATRILFANGEYSTFNSVYDLLNNDYDDANSIVVFALGDIIEYLPVESENAKQWLIYITNNDSNDLTRSVSLETLFNYFPIETVDLGLDIFNQENSYMLKYEVFKSLISINYAGLKNFFYENLTIADYSDLRYSIADSLLSIFGEPSDFKAVISYQPNEPDETARSLMGYSISDFIPPNPDTLNWQGMITKLLSYTDELFQYSWIKNEETRDYYIQKLNAVNEAVGNHGATAEACTIINEQLLPKAEQDLKDKLITTEGYKFLYYYTIYIKEEIEKEYGACQ